MLSIRTPHLPLILLLPFLFSACQPQATQEQPLSITQAIVDAATHIKEDDIRADIEEISSDAYGGRGPGTEGDRMTQAYLVSTLKALGLTPGAENNSWLQPFELIALDAQQPDTWSFTTPNGIQTYQQSSDFIVAGGKQALEANLQQAQLIFVGYGIQAPEYGWDDYKGVDVSGKVLIMMNNDPDWDPNLFGGEMRMYYGRWTYKYEIAAKLGAAGVIIIHTDHSAGYPWQVVQTSWTGPQFELPNEGEPTLEVKGWMSNASISDLLASAGQNLDSLRQQAQSKDFQPVNIPITTDITLPITITTNTSANVLARLPGGDLSDEVIIYTAHHDHLGIGVASSPDEDVIYNGALDNATGVASVLAISKAFTQLPNTSKRSLLFAFVGAEEQGLLGSKYLAQHPPVAPGKIAAAINMDGAQINGRSLDISYVGFGRSTVDQAAQKAADLQGRVIKGDQDPSKGYFYRSDHFSLAKIGVPSLNFEGGEDLRNGGIEAGKAFNEIYTNKNYHQPSDEITSDWLFDGMVEDAQFGFYTGWVLANQTDFPAWYAGDEFEAARLAALKAIEVP
jgi:Zn-dependent M28 family amino/carboxypeptidase